MGATEEEHQPSHQYTFLPNVTPKQQLLTALFDEHFISAYKAKLAIQSGALTTELTEHIKRVFVDASACFSEEIFGADTVETARVLVFGHFATKRFFMESGERQACAMRNLKEDTGTCIHDWVPRQLLFSNIKVAETLMVATDFFEPCLTLPSLYRPFLNPWTAVMCHLRCS